ncbi:MAG: hypothetical protein ACOZNI_26830 [Myxococcota bacterium]
MARFLFALLLAGAVTAAGTLVPAALAEAPTPFQQDVIELLRPTDLVGDGGSPADLYLLALYPDGKPIVGLPAKARMTVDGGTAGELADLGNGLYKLTFTPEKVESAKSASFSLEGKLPDKRKVERSWTAPIAPPLAKRLQLAANPGELTLGVDKTASLSFRLTGGDPRTYATTKLTIASSTGAVGALTNLGAGQFSGLFTPPAGSLAQVALITAVDAGDTARTYAAAALPLLAKSDQTVTVAPNARVILKVGGREFGPVQADAKGRAKVPVIVRPGAAAATRVVIAPDGTVSETPFDLKLPDTRRIALFPLATGIPADGRMQVPVRAFVVTPDGRPDENALVTFTATSGSVGSARHEGGGVYVATYVPATGNLPTTGAVTVTVGERPVDKETRPLALVPVRPSKLTLRADPPTLAAGATALTVIARVEGPGGEGLPGRAVTFVANGAKLAKVEDLKNGEYKATFTPTGKGPVEVAGRISAPSTGNGLAHVVLLPSRERVPPDGLSSAMFTVATLDEFGYPVPGVEVELKLVAGDGSLPERVTTGPDGIAPVYYTAGRKTGFVGVDALAGDRAAGASMVQAPPEVTLPALPVAGSAATRALLDDWKGTIAELRVERGG